MENSEITILIHGFFRNNKDMKSIEIALQAANKDVISVNLPTTFSSFSNCVNKLIFETKHIFTMYKSINFVVHSLGGLILLDFLRKTKHSNIKKCVFISTPFKGTFLANIANFIPLYSRIFKTIPVLKINRDEITCATDAEIMLIAGDKASCFLGKLFLDGQNDGLVEVSSALELKADKILILPYNHQEIHHKRETITHILQFLS